MARTRNTQSNKALQTMRNLLAAGWRDEHLMIDAAAEAIGGDEAAKLTAMMVWRQHFAIMGTN